ncbi:tetratricopeptide repeat protein [Polymorphobacter sp. PAMC 29334]|uniref:tetratricopeptide repeat protein n=1 Tax=Polymorphobacter sp. PAMC 29334 TaxID=2862331 RepID=UPI001C776BD6|nr:tetratricopeptide repeat protein [Polymorphobacter sp. PAMC 29334]QYE34884.1 tetratricopeptide repeat protein [Polymorphobacter sp. PAMC 29334]
MAKPDVRDEAFLREVDDEYRRSQFVGFWQRYGRMLAIGIVVFLVALAAFLFWRQDRARRAGETGERFNLALTQVEAGNFTGASAVFADLAKSGTPGYRALAQLMQAATAVQSGDIPKGLTIYRAISADTAIAKPFRDLATIKATRLEYDTLAPATVIERLKPYSVPGDPWFAVAAEMTGIAELKLNHPDRAAPLFVAIVRDQQSPPSIRNRAAQLAIALGTDPASLIVSRTSTSGLAK